MQNHQVTWHINKRCQCDRNEKLNFWAEVGSEGPLLLENFGQIEQNVVMFSVSSPRLMLIELVLWVWGTPGFEWATRAECKRDTGLARSISNLHASMLCNLTAPRHEEFLATTITQNLNFSPTCLRQTPFVAAQGILNPCPALGHGRCNQPMQNNCRHNKCETAPLHLVQGNL